jgi:ring-1,2-phenylacetyl-CoA epoxidase subunit PaaC
VRHSGEWIISWATAPGESRRVQRALDHAWRYTAELFVGDEVEQRLAAQGLAVDPASVRDAWSAQVRDVANTATLTVPADGFMARGGRVGKHTEHLGHLLAEMQIVARSHPGAKW